MRDDKTWILRFKATLVFLLSPIALGNSAAQLNYQEAPTKTEWQFFIKSPKEFKSRLWVDSQSGEKKGLAVWSWQWRLGWLRACKKFADLPKAKNPKWCKTIEKLAVRDNALVVRSEAVQVLKSKSSFYSEKRLLKLIQMAFEHPGNYRNKKPLFIINRILFALHELGTPKALKLLSHLSSKDPRLREYAKKLKKSRRL